MEHSGTVLIVARRGGDWTDCLDVLSERYAYRVVLVGSVAEALTTMSGIHVDLAVAEDRKDESIGLDFLTRLRVSHPEIMRVYVATGGSPLSYGTLTKAAIYQFLLTPLDATQLGLVVERALEARELARRHRILSREFKISGDVLRLGERRDLLFRPESHQFEKLVYASEKMAELCDLAKQAATTELPILIQGETGTGKELLARAIHYNSPRRTSPLLIQNCGGMPDDLLQSELFGHKRGAFTGAISDRLGLFRAADGGTVFLDEISEVSPSFQVSLLRFLQEGEVKPLGSDKVEHCSVRIIAASNRSLKDMVARREFRQDLYFRLKGFELEVPPLRERRDDIAPLSEFFAAKHADGMGRKILGITASTIEKLSACDFPGNVRELENEIRRMVALAKDGEYITTRNMSASLLASAAARSRSDGPRGFVPEGATLKDRVESLEKQIVGSALLRNHWNQSRTAAELGLSRVGLSNKIKRYNLEQQG
ncbi:MAG: sigma-54 dependent transcriptional regulator [Bradyrhizobium sp.]|jgi:two-component system response regulator HupR/HoxA|uniref:Sigma-54-dependent Fis family transcriptional regulator n=1 Tax=Bradyrhizobium denitrificans TaxID=2734912 RepID=A0ABS5GDA1_9BRAD|nr:MULTISPECIES: sigma-54 dependent transcriptional regulator [Nitrobacteraceae]ABQ32744.1 Two-component response regulator protein [Bradyrhizobium sp. BTAi1]MBR1138954.1 sigma-54-dependent Fis family transcriptional regulator [Bradyrhizobium denitrificans]CEJ12884.1 Hydrogenase transcriptional regulatory protein hupR1 [bacterium YEK0313]